MIINLISHLTEEKSASFSSNLLVNIFRYLDPINLPYVIFFMANLFAQKPNTNAFKSH